MEHGPMFYLSSWLLALLFSATALFLAFKAPFLRKIRERKEGYRSTASSIGFRLGGFFLAGIFLLLLLGDSRLEHTESFIAFFIGTTAIMVFSLADDLAHVAWPWHLGFQILLGILLFTSGLKIEIGTYFPGLSALDDGLLTGLFLVLVWLLLIMNALNWADGIDGLMPGVAAISFGVLFLLALRPEVNQPAVAILSIMLFGLSLSLLFFNWYPARILAGTGGAYFFGFALAVLGLYAGMKIATLFLVLVVPVFDALFVIVRRICLGHSPFQPDQEHLHHLLRLRGWSVSQVAAAYLFFTTCLALLALSFEEEKKLIFFISSGILIILASSTLHFSLMRAKK